MVGGGGGRARARVAFCLLSLSLLLLVSQSQAHGDARQPELVTKVGVVMDALGKIPVLKDVALLAASHPELATRLLPPSVVAKAWASVSPPLAGEDRAPSAFRQELERVVDSSLPSALAEPDRQAAKGPSVDEELGTQLLVQGDLMFPSRALANKMARAALVFEAIGVLAVAAVCVPLVLFHLGLVWNPVDPVARSTHYKGSLSIFFLRLLVTLGGSLWAIVQARDGLSFDSPDEAPPPPPASLASGGKLPPEIPVTDVGLVTDHNNGWPMVDMSANHRTLSQSSYKTVKYTPFPNSTPTPTPRPTLKDLANSAGDIAKKLGSGNLAGALGAAKDLGKSAGGLAKDTAGQAAKTLKTPF